MFSTVRCCLEWERVQPEQPHRADIHQPPLSLDRGLNCFQIFYYVICNSLFCLSKVYVQIFILFQCACEASYEKRKNVFNFQNIYVTADDRNHNPILHHCFHSSSENPLYRSLSLFSPLPCSRGGGVKKWQLPCKRPNVQLFEFEKNRKQNIILCVFISTCVEISLVDILNKIWCAGGVQAPN